MVGLIAAAVLMLLDFQNLLSWWRGRTLRPAGEPTDDYTILVPLFGHPRYFHGRECLEPVKQRVMVCCDTTPAVMAAYADELEAAGFGVLRTTMDAPNQANLVHAGLNVVQTRLALRMDADTMIDGNIACAAGAFAASGADIGSFRIEARKPHTLAGWLQAMEYRIAMLTRRYRPWMTSGALLIGRTQSLLQVCANHSMWTPGEDIEIGRVALALGMKIRHMDYVAYTEVPGTWKALYRQRLLWWAGTFRHTVVNFDRNILQMPAMMLYCSLGAWLGIYFHVWTSMSLHSLVYLPELLLVYAVITMVSNLQVLSPWMLLFPVYAMVQAFVMPPLGAIHYVRLAASRRNLGRYQFGFKRRLAR